MALQKTKNFFGQLRPNSFSRGNVFDARFPQPIYRSELSQEQILPVLTDTWAVVENALIDPFLEQQLMISVGKSMCFVADPLQ